MELALTATFVASVIVGCLIGLLPGLPIWVGPLLLIPFIDQLSLAQILIFWVGCSIGCQYFGSVAALLLKVPGEASSLIYLQDIDQLSWAERIETIRQTAWGSFVASIGALAVMLVVTWFDPASIMSVGNFTVKFYIYVVMLATLIWFSEHRIWALMLFLIGVFLSEKTNQTLPVELLIAQRSWDDLTPFTLLLGLIIIPEWLQPDSTLKHTIDRFTGYIRKPLDWITMVRAGAVGAVTGLIPGPAATISSMITYTLFKGSVSQRIVAAESANNSAIVTGMFPFLVFGIPIGLDQIAVSYLLELKVIAMPAAMFAEFGNIRYYDLVLYCIISFSLVYLFLSQAFLKMYTNIIQQLHHRLWAVYVLLIAGVVYIDITYTTVDLARYFVLLCVTTLVGLVMRRFAISPLPLILGFMLGDQITWSVYHYIKTF
jgi:putative tricarboxylic transport membrane protein